MGLTGSIVEVTFRLLRIQTARIRQETVKCADLDETIAACETPAAGPTPSLGSIASPGAIVSDVV